MAKVRVIDKTSKGSLQSVIYKFYYNLGSQRLFLGQSSRQVINLSWPSPISCSETDKIIVIIIENILLQGHFHFSCKAIWSLSLVSQMFICIAILTFNLSLFSCLVSGAISYKMINNCWIPVTGMSCYEKVWLSGRNF